MGQNNQDDMSESVSQVDPEKEKQKAADQADTKEQQEFYEAQTGQDDPAQGYGH